jgi:hypothetical protein
MVGNELCKICERADADAWDDMLRAAPSLFVDRFQLKQRRDGDLVVGTVGTFDIVALNRAVGIGIDAPATEAEVKKIIALFESSGSRRHAIQLCPTASRPETIEMLEGYGFTHFNNWTKLYRKVGGEIPDLETPYRIQEITTSDARAFADIVCPAFGWPGLLRQWVAALVGREGWKHYMAFDGERPIGTGAMFVSRGVAWMGFASTDPGYRRRGAQSGLIRRRLIDAQSLECTHAVVETAEDKEEKPNPSYHNLVRFGFVPAYQRPNYLRVNESNE